MKDWTNWGTKIRAYNYKAIWANLKTIRVGTRVAKELPPEKEAIHAAIHKRQAYKWHVGRGKTTLTDEDKRKLKIKHNIR